MGKKDTANTIRRRFRQKLERWGMSEKEIDLCMEQVKERQILKEQGKLPDDAPLCTRGAYVYLLKQQPGVTKKSTPHLRFGDDYEHPSDNGFKPTNVDSVLKGVARATGQTAKAVKRRKTITKFEYDNEG